LINDLLNNVSKYDQTEKFYTYVYLDPFSPEGEYTYPGIDKVFKHEIFYVGKGTGNRDRDFRKREYSQFLNNKINKINKVGREIIIERVYDNISEVEAFIHEAFIIASVGRRDLNLGTAVNLTDGDNRRGAGIKITNLQTGKKATPAQLEHIMYLAEFNRGKKQSVSQKEKKAKAIKDKTGVTKMDLAGNTIKEYESAVLAAKDNHCSLKNIYKVCEGIRETCAGFKWKFTHPDRINFKKRSFSDEYKKKMVLNSTRNKKVVKIDIKTGKELETYISVANAGLKSNINPRRICDACKGIQAQAGGFKWKYAT
jgi:hypothetical protein